MTSKQHGGIFGRNPAPNSVTVDGTVVVRLGREDKDRH
jgi:hypothetical protein